MAKTIDSSLIYVLLWLQILQQASPYSEYDKQKRIVKPMLGQRPEIQTTKEEQLYPISGPQSSWSNYRPAQLKRNHDTEKKEVRPILGDWLGGLYYPMSKLVFYHDSEKRFHPATLGFFDNYVSSKLELMKGSGKQKSQVYPIHDVDEFLHNSYELLGKRAVPNNRPNFYNNMQKKRMGLLGIKKVLDNLAKTRKKPPVHPMSDALGPQRSRYFQNDHLPYPFLIWK